jgi:transposase
MVHVSDTCEPTAPHLLTHVHTTAATVHEAQCTIPLQQARIDQELPPQEPFVDAAYVSAELLVQSRDEQGITLRGPTRPSQGWQRQVEGAYRLDQCVIDWERQQVHCPQGKTSVSWAERVAPADHPFVQVRFSTQDCGACAQRACCTHAKPPQARTLKFHPRPQYEALQAAQAWYARDEGQLQYARRAGVEGTLSQGGRAFGLRHTRYRGLPKTHVQHGATAAAINIDRMVAWLDERPRALTRISRFAALAPANAYNPGEAAA